MCVCVALVIEGATEDLLSTASAPYKCTVLYVSVRVHSKIKHR